MTALSKARPSTERRLLLTAARAARCDSATSTAPLIAGGSASRRTPGSMLLSARDRIGTCASLVLVCPTPTLAATTLLAARSTAPLAFLPADGTTPMGSTGRSDAAGLWLAFGCCRSAIKTSGWASSVGLTPLSVSCRLGCRYCRCRTRASSEMPSRPLPTWQARRL